MCENVVDRIFLWILRFFVLCADFEGKTCLNGSRLLRCEFENDRLAIDIFSEILFVNQAEVRGHSKMMGYNRSDMTVEHVNRGREGVDIRFGGAKVSQIVPFF